MFLEPLKYEDLKDAYKVEAKSPSLFIYLLNNNEFADVKADKLTEARL
mgnify:CR=1 FL=1